MGTPLPLTGVLSTTPLRIAGPRHDYQGCRSAWLTLYAASVVNYIRSVRSSLGDGLQHHRFRGGRNLTSRPASPRSTNRCYDQSSELPFVQLEPIHGSRQLWSHGAVQVERDRDALRYTDGLWSQWEQVTTTHSAKAGNYGAEKWSFLATSLDGWGASRPSRSLSPDGPYWDMVGGLMTTTPQPSRRHQSDR